MRTTTPPISTQGFQLRPWKLATRLAVAAGWAIAAVAGVVLVLAGALVATAGALTLGSLRGVAGARTRFAGRARPVPARPAAQIAPKRLG